MKNRYVYGKCKRRIVMRSCFAVKDLIGLSAISPCYPTLSHVALFGGVIWHRMGNTRWAKQSGVLLLQPRRWTFFLDETRDVFIGLLFCPFWNFACWVFLWLAYSRCGSDSLHYLLASVCEDSGDGFVGGADGIVWGGLLGMLSIAFVATLLLLRYATQAQDMQQQLRSKSKRLPTPAESMIRNGADGTMQRPLWSRTCRTAHSCASLVVTNWYNSIFLLMQGKAPKGNGCESPCLHTLHNIPASMSSLATYQCCGRIKYASSEWLLSCWITLNWRTVRRSVVLVVLDYF